MTARLEPDAAAGFAKDAAEKILPAVGRSRQWFEWRALEEAMGALARHCASLAELGSALEWARTTDRTTVISIATDAFAWVPGDADWDVGVPEVSSRPQVNAARADYEVSRAAQRLAD